MILIEFLQFMVMYLVASMAWKFIASKTKDSAIGDAVAWSVC